MHRQDSGRFGPCTLCRCFFRVVCAPHPRWPALPCTQVTRVPRGFAYANFASPEDGALPACGPPLWATVAHAPFPTPARRPSRLRHEKLELPGPPRAHDPRHAEADRPQPPQVRRRQRFRPPPPRGRHQPGAPPAFRAPRPPHTDRCPLARLAQELHDFFDSEIGGVVCVRVATAGTKPKGHGYVQFNSKEQAERAQTKVCAGPSPATPGAPKLTPSPHPGADPARPSPQGRAVPAAQRAHEVRCAPPPLSPLLPPLTAALDRNLRFTNVYVKGFPPSWGDDDLREAFSGSGTVTSLCVRKVTVNGEDRAFGFVNFETSEQAVKAISEMHDKLLTDSDGVRLLRPRPSAPPVRAPHSPLVPGADGAPPLCAACHVQGGARAREAGGLRGAPPPDVPVHPGPQPLRQAPRQRRRQRSPPPHVLRVRRDRERARDGQGWSLPGLWCGRNPGEGALLALPLIPPAPARDQGSSASATLPRPPAPSRPCTAAW